MDDIAADHEASTGTAASLDAAGRVKAVFALYSSVAGPAESDQMTLQDLLTDLMHRAASAGLDFEDALSLARGHFEAEKPN